MSLKTVRPPPPDPPPPAPLPRLDKGWEHEERKGLILTILTVLLGVGALVLIASYAMRADARVPTTDVHPMTKVQREDDLERGVSCYWLYTGSGGGVALSCIALTAADAGPR